MQRSRKKTSLWNLFFHNYSIVYAFCSGILLLPIILNFINIELYGVWLASTCVINWFTMFDPGISSVLTQQVSNYLGKKDHERVSGIVCSGFVLALLFAVLFILFGLIFFESVHSYVNTENVNKVNDFKWAIYLALFATSIICFSYSLTAINQGFQSSLGVGLIYMFTTFTELLLIIIFLNLGYSLISFGLSMLYRGIMLSILNIIYFIWRMKCDDFTLFFSLTGFSQLSAKVFYTFFSKSIDGIAKNLDLVLINNFLGSQFVPLLTVTKKSSTLIRSLLERPALALFPTISNLNGTGDIQKTKFITIRLINLITWTIGLFSSGLYLLNYSFVSLWVGSEFYAGTLINGALIVSMIIISFSNMLSTLCYSIGNIKGNSIILFIQSILSIPLMFLGIKYFDMFGAISLPLISIVLVSLWYYPKILITKLKINNFELLGIIKEIILTFITFILVIFLIRNIFLESWYSFIYFVFFISILFVFILFSFSKSFRYESKNIFEILKLKIT